LLADVVDLDIEDLFGVKVGFIGGGIKVSLLAVLGSIPDLDAACRIWKLCGSEGHDDVSRVLMRKRKDMGLYVETR
jgi:hypothetical protein